jgi:acyl-coenzyme A thioesterase PaaI-like protein
MTTTEIPEGFEPYFRKSPLTEPWEPLYARRDPTSVAIGVRIAEAHTNARGFAHAGMVAALVDNSMGYSCAQVTGWTTSYVTVSLAIDYVGSAQVGQWLVVESEVIKTGSTLCFAQCLAKADDAVVARANATFRVVPKPKEWPNKQ